MHMADGSYLSGEGRERRYYAVPDDRLVKSAAHAWAEKVALEDCATIVLSTVGGLVRLSVGEYDGGLVATLYTTRIYSVPHVQAVSGWGPTAELAIRELAFRWQVLMGRSWLTEQHVVRAGVRSILLVRLDDVLRGVS